MENAWLRNQTVENLQFLSVLIRFIKNYSENAKVQDCK